MTPQLRSARTKNLAQTPSGNQFKVSRKLIPLKKTSVGQNDKIMQSQEESCMLPLLMFPLPKNVDHRWSRSWKKSQESFYYPKNCSCLPLEMCLSEYLFCRSYYYRTDLPGALNQINEYKSVGPSMLISGRVLKKLLLSSRSSPHGMASQLIGSFPYLASNRAGHQSPRGRQKHKGLSIFIGPESDHWLCLLVTD